MTFTERLISIFVSPYKAIKDIEEKSYILPMFLIMTVLMMITTQLALVLQPYTMESLSSAMIERYGVKFYDYMFSSSAQNPSVKMMSQISVLIFTPVITIIQAAFSTACYFLFLKIFGGKTTYKNLFSMYIHISVVTGVLGIFVLLVQLLLKTGDYPFALSIFLPNGNLFDTWFLFLSAINLSTVWRMFLIGTGIHALCGFSMKKTVILTSIVFMVTIAVTIAGGSLSIIIYDFVYNAVKHTL